MSYDLAVLSAVGPLTADAALQAYLALCEGGRPLADDVRIADVVRDLVARWPQIYDVPDDEIDDSPWSIAFDVSGAHLLVAMRYPSAPEVVPVLTLLALSRGLYVFNPQSLELRGPEGTTIAAEPVAAAEDCVRCGRAIDPGEASAEQPGSPGRMHLSCLFSAPG